MGDKAVVGVVGDKAMVGLVEARAMAREEGEALGGLIQGETRRERISTAYLPVLGARGKTSILSLLTRLQMGTVIS